MIKKSSRQETKIKRHRRSRKTLFGTPRRPRLAVFRSQKQIYVQLIDDTKSITLAHASSLEKEVKALLKNLPTKPHEPKQEAKEETKAETKAEKGKKKEAKAEKPVPGTPAITKFSQLAKAVGQLAAKRAIEKGIHEVVFDRGGLQFHGRIKALADAAREAGLKF